MSDAGDPTQTPDDEPGIHSFEIDPSIYLPEGVRLADPDEEPDRADGANVTDAAVDRGDDAGSRTDTAPAEEVDTTLLERIEGELDEVDEALLAIDRGDEGSSPLLRRLLGDRLDG